MDKNTRSTEALPGRRGVISGPGKDDQAAVIMQIKAELAAKDWKQSDLAEAADIPTSTLSRYIIGSRDLPFPAFADICAALGLPMSELIDRAQRRRDGNRSV